MRVSLLRAFPGILVDMRVRVLAFGVLRERLRGLGETVELPEGSTAGKLIEQIRGAGEDFAWDSIAVAVNREYGRLDTVLHEGDEVALLPPVSGGSYTDGAGAASNGLMTESGKIAIVRERIDAERIVSRMKAGADGAVCVFDGIVRDNTRGRRTLHLDYEAYEEMALKQMRELVSEAVAKFGVRDVALVHRLGQLEVGETSVLIVVASVHRTAAFEACRWLIDTLKKTVPIWKKEHFVDGAVWADGEPFPTEIATSTGVKA